MKDIKEITEKLEQGVKEIYESEKYKAYLDFMGKFWDYSFNNCVLIMMQKPEATLVAGYRAWQNKFKRFVKKGEKGITILAPCPKKYTKEVEDENGNIEVKEINYTTFRACTVFDISQTEGEEVPNIVRELSESVENYAELLDKLITLSPVPVAFEDVQGGANGYYSHVEKRIVIKAGMGEMQTVKTLVHEISHAILHNKDDGEEMEATKHEKEVQAESVAYTVCNALGLDTSDYSFGYIAGWSKGKEMKELSASMEVIRKTAKAIIEDLRAA